jgi:hypothetical protein
MTAAKNSKPPTAEQAAAIVEAERQERASACHAEIVEVLERHSCRMDPVITIRPEGIIPQIDIVPLGPQS